MKKLVVIALLISTLLVTFTACGKKESSTSSSNQQSQARKETLKVALDTAYRPMEWEENHAIKGFDVDLIKAIAKETGREVVLKSVPWDGIFDKLYAGEYDLIISSVAINDERKKTMLFSDPYFDSVPLILTRKSSSIQNAKDLVGKKVAVQSGTTTDELINKNLAGVTVKKFEVATDALTSFTNKEVDAVVLDGPVILDYTKTEGKPDYITVEDKSFFSQEQFGIAANKGKENLINEINAAMKKLKTNGEYQKIYDKYFSK